MGRRGIFYSFKFFLPAFAALRGRGGGSAPCACAKETVAPLVFITKPPWFRFVHFLAIVEQDLCALCLRIRNGVLNFMSAVGIVFIIANNYTRRHWETLMGSHGMGEFATNWIKNWMTPLSPISISMDSLFIYLKCSVCRIIPDETGCSVHGDFIIQDVGQSN